MATKAILVLVDGMRPDGMMQCGSPAVERLLAAGTSTLNARTVMPSVTLPCHMSLFHSVTPARHGVTTNTFTPQVRPVNGLCEQLYNAGKECTFFYTWEELRDLSRPDSLGYALMRNQHHRIGTDASITDDCIAYIQRERPDFTFLYLGETDELGGHNTGWMSPTYMDVVKNAMDCIGRLYDSLPEDYVLIFTADHGGHDRSHGTDLPEDMTIPLVMIGKEFEAGKSFEGDVSILDIAPTIVDLLGALPAREWEGKSLLR